MNCLCICLIKSHGQAESLHCEAILNLIMMAFIAHCGIYMNVTSSHTWICRYLSVVSVFTSYSQTLARKKSLTCIKSEHHIFIHWSYENNRHTAKIVLLGDKPPLHRTKVSATITQDQVYVTITQDQVSATSTQDQGVFYHYTGPSVCHCYTGPSV